MSGTTTTTAEHTLAARGNRPCSRDEDLADLADIDAEIERAVSAASPTSNPSDDQATRLRRLLADSAQDVETRWEPRQSPPPPLTPPRPVRPHRPINPTPSPALSAQTIAIASGKGGVGKTTISVNLAIALAARGLRATLLDADLGTANADLLCGLSPKARLEHVLAPDGAAAGRWADAAPKSIRDIAIKAPGGFRLVPGAAGVARMADLTAPQRRALVRSLADIERDSDVVLIDTAAGVGRSVTDLIEAADLTLIIATPEPTSIADAYALIKCAIVTANDIGHPDPTDPGPPHVALVINQAADESEARAVHARIAAVADRFLGVRCPMLGWIAQDLRVAEAVRARVPLTLRSPKAPASHNISILAASLVQHLGLSRSAKPFADHRRGLSGLVRRLLGISSPSAGENRET